MRKTVIWKSSHAIHRLVYHIVFIPKYRREILQGKLNKRLQELFYEAAKTNDWFVHELSIKPDHLHLMIQLSPNITLAKAVMHLKGGSSRVIRKEFPELREFLWGESLWQDGYFAETVGRIDEMMMRNYIKHQWEREQATSHGL
jgi:putative transposase